jgi:signal transduction histidine kinase
MQPDTSGFGGRAVPLAATSDSSMIEQTAASLVAATGAKCAFLERLTADPAVVEVLGSSGEGAPAPGPWPARTGTSPGMVVLPLLLDGVERGALVALGIAPERTADPALVKLLDPLACAGALALRNRDLRDRLPEAAAESGERHFRLVSGTAHHLRDLLGVSSAYLQLLEAATSLTPRQLEYVRSSRRNMELSVRLMAELLDLGRVETGRMALEWAATDVRAVIRSMLKDYQRADLTRGIGVEIRLDDALPVIPCDFDMLHRVLDTLLSNAFRYSPPGSAVSISAEVRSGRRADDPGSWVCVTVADQGPGVRQRDDVFEEIARVEASTSPGLRLAISRHLARLLGGDLRLDSPSGTGSTFTLWLPVPAGSSSREQPPLHRSRAGGRDPALT